MAGTTASFYRIPVTIELNLAVATGSTPPTATVIQRLILPVTDMAEYWRDGMVPLHNRWIVLQCFLALKSHMVSYESFMVLKIRNNVFI